MTAIHGGATVAQGVFPSARYRRSSAVLWRHSGGAVVLLSPAADQPVALQGPGRELWDLLSQPHSLAEAAATLALRFGMDPAAVQSAIEPVLEHLHDLAAVEKMAPAESPTGP